MAQATIVGGMLQDNYGTNYQVHGNDARFRSGDLIGATWAGNAATSDVIIGTNSPRALTQRQLNDAIVNGVITGISRLGLLEKHSEVIEIVQKLPLPTIVVDPPDLSPVQDMMTELTSVIRGALSGLRNEIREDMSVLQREVLKNRDDAKSQAEEIRREVRRFHDTEFSQVVKELRRIEIPKSNVDGSSFEQEFSNMRSILDQRLASLQSDVCQLRDGLGAMRVVLPQTQTKVNQVLQPGTMQPGTMRRMVSSPTMQTQQVQTCMSPRLVAENYGPLVNLPPVPLAETVQMKVSPVELQAVTETIVKSEGSILEDGRYSPRAGGVSPLAPRSVSPGPSRSPSRMSASQMPQFQSWGAQYAGSSTI